MMMMKLKGEWLGGVVMFIIMFIIAIIGLHVVKAFQGVGGSTAGSLAGGALGGNRGGAGGPVTTPRQARGGGKISPCIRKGGTYLCPEENKTQ